LTLGVPAIDAKLKLPAEGKLIVVTGVPSHGKSTFMRFVAMRTHQRYGRKWLVFVQEDDFHDYVIDCTKIYTGKPFGEITREDWREVGLSLMNGGLRVLEYEGDTDPPTMDNIFSKARLSILRDGTTDLLIDPFNEVEDAYEHGKMTQTEHIARTLQDAKQFAKRFSCNIWIIAHPAKPMNGDRGTPPSGYSISGSANWFNKSDLGFTIWRPAKDKGEVEIHIWKSRNSKRWAAIDTVASAWFNQATDTYHDPLPKEGDPEPQVDEGYRNRVFD
jgi:twinkle protein